MAQSFLEHICQTFLLHGAASWIWLSFLIDRKELSDCAGHKEQGGDGDAVGDYWINHVGKGN